MFTKPVRNTTSRCASGRTSSRSIRWPAHFDSAVFTRSLVTAVALAAATTVGAAAQSTNLSLFQELAVECLGDLPPAVTRIVLEAPDEMPYLRSALVATWQDDGAQIFMASDPGDGVRVAYDIEEAKVTYQTAGGEIGRDVRLALRFTITDESGLLLADERCARSRSDLVTRGQIEALESDAYPETHSELPRGGWLPRIVEPAVVTAASAVAVYLFFTLRSTGGDS